MKVTGWNMGAIGACVAGVMAVALAGAPAAQAGTFKLNPGDSIQDAVDSAQPKDKILLAPGDYFGADGNTAAVRITKPLKIIGKKKGDLKARILPGVGNLQGVLVEPNVDGDPDIEGFMIKGVVVEGFEKNGIWLRHVNNFKILKNESVNNLENGIFPTLSAKGKVIKNIAYGAEDSALWVEASEDVRVMKNDLSLAPTGLEVTVSNNVQMKSNDIHDNVVGVGLYHPNAAALDPIPVMENWVFTKNHVYDNNLTPNPAPEGSMPANLPTGGGILVLGVDGVTVSDNLVENNDFYGVAIVNWCLAVADSAFECPSNPPIDGDPAARNNVIVDNTFINNGTNPEPGHPLEGFAADMTFVELTASGNCFAGNTYDSYASYLNLVPVPPACP